MSPVLGLPGDCTSTSSPEEGRALTALQSPSDTDGPHANINNTSRAGVYEVASSEGELQSAETNRS